VEAAGPTPLAWRAPLQPRDALLELGERLEEEHEPRLAEHADVVRERREGAAKLRVGIEVAASAARGAALDRGPSLEARGAPAVADRTGSERR
jgi:hypothetical protein